MKREILNKRKRVPLSNMRVGRKSQNFEPDVVNHILNDTNIDIVIIVKNILTQLMFSRSFNRNKLIKAVKFNSGIVMTSRTYFG